MLDVWRNVFVVWMGSSHVRIMRVGEVIIPIELLSVLVHLVTVTRDQCGREVDFFEHAQPEADREKTSPSAIPV